MAEFLVILTFDADTTKHDPNYDCADKALESIGFYRNIEKADGTDVELPFNTYAGKFTGETAGGVASDVANRAAEKLPSCDIVGRVFAVACSDWAWSKRKI
jgi:hypothetical protein